VNTTEAAEPRERACFFLRVRPDRLDEYRRRHMKVWPEMRAALSRAGWRNYSLFLREDGLLVGYLETTNFETAVAAMQEEEINTLWQAEMAPFFELPEGGAPDTTLERLAEIFHLD
jgi:L-rhamnose mutarotase